MHCRGFPNSFFFGPAQGGFTANYTHSLDEQSIHLAYILKSAKEKGARLSDPKDKQRSKVPPVSQYNNEAQLKEMNYSIYTDPEHFDICPGAEAVSYTHLTLPTNREV